jgi:multidrug transporter EmrE-like cation transporter
MSLVIWGACAGAAAGLVYCAGVALQALEAKETPAIEAWQAGLITRLIRRPRWVVGTALGLVGWPIHAAALLLAPLSVVQPALAVGLVMLLAVGAKRLNEHVTRADLICVSLIVIGVVTLAVVAPAPRLAPRSPAETAAVLAVLAFGILALWLLVQRRPRMIRAAPLMAGLCFAWSGLSTQLVADAAHRGNWMLAGIWTLATAAASGLGLVAEMTALQRSAATRVAPSVFVVQVLVPVLLSPLITSGPIAHGPVGIPLSAVAVVCVAAAAGLLARSDAVLALIEEDSEPSCDNVWTESPSAEIREASASTAAAAAGPPTR